MAVRNQQNLDQQQLNSRRSLSEPVPTQRKPGLPAVVPASFALPSNPFQPIMNSCVQTPHQQSLEELGESVGQKTENDFIEYLKGPIKAT